MAVTTQNIETIATRHDLTVERSKAGHARLFGTPDTCISAQVDFQGFRLFPLAYASRSVDGIPDEGFRPHVFIHCQAIVK